VENGQVDEGTSPTAVLTKASGVYPTVRFFVGGGWGSNTLAHAPESFAFVSGWAGESAKHNAK
jgi:hypothetical protein